MHKPFAPTFRNQQRDRGRRYQVRESIGPTRTSVGIVGGYAASIGLVVIQDRLGIKSWLVVVSSFFDGLDTQKVVEACKCVYIEQVSCFHQGNVLHSCTARQLSSLRFFWFVKAFMWSGDVRGLARVWLCSTDVSGSPCWRISQWCHFKNDFRIL